MSSRLLRQISRRLSKTEELIALEDKYNCHNYKPLPVMIERGSGVWIWDVEGKRYMDCLSAYSALNHGHLHPRIKQALISQIDKLSLTSRAVYNNKLGAGLKALCETTGYPRSVFMNTGVESGETALKMARRWGYEVKGIPQNQAWVLFAKGNFWGRTLAACASSDDPDRYHNFGPFDMNFKLIDYNSSKALAQELAKNKNVAAFMVEPVQGEAGVIIPSLEYLTEVRKICTENNVLLIADEVQTGLGRTGKVLCQEHSGVRADLICLGKSLSGGFFPVSAVCGTNEVFDRMVPGSHGSTFGGNPLAATVCAEALKVMREEGLVENSRVMGLYLLEGLKKLLKGRKAIKEVRGLGLFIAIEVFAEHDAAVYAKKLLKQGIISKQTHEVVLRICPPLIVQKEHCDFILERVDKAFAE